MNLDQVNKSLTLVANIGVVAGIVVVAIQLQQNTNAFRVQSACHLMYPRPERREYRL